jgi:hypothetical protein
VDKLVQLLDACAAHDDRQQLEMMRSCRDPVIWLLFLKGLRAQEVTARSNTLQQLQIEGVRLYLARMLKGEIKLVHFSKLAEEVFLTGLPFTPAAAVHDDQCWASARVQQQLWRSVQEVLPRVRCNRDKRP